MNRCPKCNGGDMEDCQPIGDEVSKWYCNDCKKYFEENGDEI